MDLTLVIIFHLIAQNALLQTSQILRIFVLLRPFNLINNFLILLLLRHILLPQGLNLIMKLLSLLVFLLNRLLFGYFAVGIAVLNRVFGFVSCLYKLLLCLILLICFAHVVVVSVDLLDVVLVHLFVLWSLVLV